ncbi:nitrate- and nitrite sensing domain-containing protein [Actinoplanes sp. NPDC048967]|uniref:sensor histidine kinase n=1 Tax=Actinoplanes sp. NPDC048967 TaxID=3155269 RepID=UPI00340BCC0F
MRTRNWSIRSKIIALAAVPLTALLALWVFATGVTAGPALKLLSAQTLVDKVGSPGERLVGQLQLERRLSVAYLSDDQAVPPALVAQRASTDRAAADFRRSAGSADAQDAADDVLRTRIRQLVSDLDGLNENRQHIDRREVDALGAQNLYNSMVESGFRMFVATAAFGDERIDRKIRAVVTIARGQDYLSRTNSLVGGALAAGELSAPARNDLVQAISMSRFLLAEGVTDLPAQDRTAYQKLSTGASFSRLSELQDELLSDSRPGTALPITAAEWRPTFDTATQQLTAFEVNAVAALPGDARPVAVDVLVRLGLAGLLGLIAFIISIIVSVRVGRSMVGRLTRLRGEALEMAGERLPTVVKRLQRGEAVDVEVETPPLEYGRDEIGQLGRAFNEVQRTAVQSAVEEANVRRGINEVFLNIARRSQTLLHRQLALLDKMERRETEPDELEDLYRVDHLATRMRRHAEDLVILAGAAPGRGWRNPVPVIDVVRGAISEVEDYKRVDIVSTESSAVLGRAVGDVIHLLAELLENAASFSPPQTRVQVVGQVLPNGYALEIEDRGLGMSPEALAEANRKLLEPPDFDPADSARLGLFVVAQLADRHGIRVSLRPSGYGGVTAVVLIPGELVTTGQGQAALPAGPTPPDTSWDRPLVGTGTEDPARSSLGALQWQGTEQVRSIAMTGRPVTINGTATAGPELTDDTVRPGSDRPEPATATGADVGDPTRPLSRHTLGLPDTPVAAPAELAATLGGPAPSAVVDGLTEDGLVQRRRTKPRRGSGQRAAPPALLPPNLTSPDGLASAPGSAVPGSSVPGSAAAGFPAPGSSAPANPPPPASLSSDFPSAGNGRTTTNGNGLTGAGLNVPGVGGPASDGPGLDGPALDGAGLDGSGSTGPGSDGLSFDAPLRHGEGPAMLGTPPQVPPRIPSPRVAPEAVPGAPNAMPGAVPGAPKAVPGARKGMPPVAPAMPKDAPADDQSADEADEPLLPRRVRQASLAPQLRGPVAEQTAAPSRSPEQVRSLMSALQQGTTRGRREAAGLAAAAAGSAPDDRASNGPETDKQQTVGEPMWSEAATVIFPAVQDPVAAGSDNSTDNAPENHENRPDKDA